MSDNSALIRQKRNQKVVINPQRTANKVDMMQMLLNCKDYIELKLELLRRRVMQRKDIKELNRMLKETLFPQDGPVIKLIRQKHI